MWLFAVLKIIYTECLPLPVWSGYVSVTTRDSFPPAFLCRNQTLQFSYIPYVLAWHLNIFICLHQARSQTFIWGGVKNNI